MDAEYHFDIAEIRDSIARAEVITLFFPLIRRTILVDMRQDEHEIPMIQLVPMVNSVDERFRYLKRTRPSLGRPESIVFVPWPKYARSLEPLGIIDAFARRFAAEGHPELADQLAPIYRELVEAEAEELRHAVRGENYQTIWERK